MGLIALGRGEHVDAVELIGRAVDTDPRQPVYHYNLGFALRAGGRLEAALAAYEQAVRLNPAFIEAQINRGIMLREPGSRGGGSGGLRGRVAAGAGPAHGALQSGQYLKQPGSCGGGAGGL